MFLTLLFVKFLVSVFVSYIVVLVFRKPIDGIMARVIADEISSAWVQYLTFSLYVVGISSGVRIFELERYLPGATGEAPAVGSLTVERWVLEVTRSVLSVLQGLAGVLLLFFIVALIAFIFVRLIEARKAKA